jgi:hypothetical protein
LGLALAQLGPVAGQVRRNVLATDRELSINLRAVEPPVFRIVAIDFTSVRVTGRARILIGAINILRWTLAGTCFIVESLRKPSL